MPDPTPKTYRLEDLAPHTRLEIYSDASDSDRFEVGELIGVSETWLLLAKIDEYGVYDGLCLLDRSEILAVSRRSLYLDKLALLRPEPVAVPDIDPELEAILSFARKNKCRVGVGFNFSQEAYGQLLAFDADRLLLHEEDDRCKRVGEKQYRMEDVIRIDVETP